MGGGSEDTYNKLRNQFKENGITVLRSPNFKNTYFNCAIIRSPKDNLSRGIYIGYDYD